MTRFTDRFACRYALQMAGMGGMASPALAEAVSATGAFGMLSGVGGGEFPLAKHLGVNFLVPFLDIAAVERAAQAVALVEFFWGDPDASLVARARAHGAACGWQVGSADEARAAVDAGVDVVVAQGVGGGGHVRGTIPWRRLLDEVPSLIDGILVIGGGIGTAGDVATAIDSGADAVRIGTRFLAATESTAHASYVDALIEATADDTVLTTAFGLGWPDAPHRVLRSCIDAGEAIGASQRWTPDWPADDYEGNPLARALYAGESVSAVAKRQSAAEIVAELVSGLEPTISSS